MNAPVWVKVEVARAIHARQLAEHGGIQGIRDEGLLSSAVARPQQQFCYSEDNADLASLAAAYAHGIAMNHPFLDGNKRTAAVVLETFVELNGHVLTASDEEMYVLVMGLAAGETSEEQVSAWIRERLQPVG